MFSICFRPVASLGCVAVARKIFVPVAVSRFRQIALLGCGKISAVENHFNKSAEVASSGSKHVAHSAFDFILPQKMVFLFEKILFFSHSRISVVTAVFLNIKKVG